MEYFCPAHCSALGVIALLTVAAVLAARRGYERAVRGVLAFGCLVIYPVNQLSYLALDFALPLNNIIPLHLCDVAGFTAAVALLSQKPLFAELTYTWGLAGTLQALLTPNLPYPPPHPVFWSFFHQHGIIVVVALVLPLGLGWRPRSRTVWRCFLWLQVYIAVALAVNFSLGTNFGFLMEPPEADTIFNYLGPWPMYWLPLEGLAFLLLSTVNVPFARRYRPWGRLAD